MTVSLTAASWSDGSSTFDRRPTALTARLSAEDQTPSRCPMPAHEVAPGAHHLVLRGVPAPARPEYTEFDPSYRYLFNSYYEAVGRRHPRPQRGLVTRPGIAEISRYREYVQDALVRALTRGDSTTEPRNSSSSAATTSSSTRSCC
jgi:hypothetical protein